MCIRDSPEDADHPPPGAVEAQLEAVDAASERLLVGGEALAVVRAEDLHDVAVTVDVPAELLLEEPVLLERRARRRDVLVHRPDQEPVSYTHLRAHETPEHLVCRLLLEKK